MNHHQLFSLLVFFCASATAAGCGFLAWEVYRARRTAAHSVAVASKAAKRLAAAEQRLEITVQQLSDQARRVAWLESRMRQKKQAGGQRADSGLPADSELVDAARTSITERRHRVLSLSRRGMDVEAIAETLGVPYGEVELIISLSAAA